MCLNEKEDEIAEELNQRGRADATGRNRSRTGNLRFVRNEQTGLKAQAPVR